MTTPALAENVKGRGRHYRHPASGELVPSVTNILGMLNKPALVGWAAKVVAEQAADLRESLVRMERDEVVTLLKGAASRKSRGAADRGTDIHGWLEAVTTGQDEPELSSAAEQYRDGARAFLDDCWGETVTTEITMFAPDYAGTADAIARLDGRTTLLDYKTSSGIYPEAALQLSALRATTLCADGKRTAEYGIERMLVVRIAPKGKYEIAEVANYEQHIEAFRALLVAWIWKHDTTAYAGRE